MIERQHGEITLMCDDCGDDLGEFYSNDRWNEMIRDAKHQDWLITKEGSDYTHHCPDCANRPLTVVKRVHPSRPK